MNRIPPPNPKVRSSNLELYRIVCMLMIVAHHYVVNSGLISSDSVMMAHPTAANSIYLFLFGMWGKTGINCFLMITGYFMCKSTITLRKFIKLLTWIYTYKVIIFLIFLITGYETISVIRIVQIIMPIWGLNSNFTSCFIVFWLTIPFWNILIQNMTKRQHQLLLCLLLGCYTILGSIPDFNVKFNYVTWFGIIYLIASYIRLYPNTKFKGTKKWGVITFVAISLNFLLAYMIILMKGVVPYFFVSDSNKIFAVLVAVSSFLWFKNMELSYSKTINMIGASTFGVLLIHANSSAMRTWLWKDAVDCVGHYAMSLPNLIVYSLGAILIIFIICIIIDIFRIKLLETPMFRLYDRRVRKQNKA